MAKLDDNAPIPDKAKICKCGHSLERHRLFTSFSQKSHVCLGQEGSEDPCPCGKFELYNIL